MHIAVSLRPLLAELLRLTVPAELGDFTMIESGARELEAALLRLGVEAYEAETRGLRLSQAAHDLANFPRLHQVHVGVLDVLTVMLDAPVLAQMERILDAPTPPIAESILLALGQMAGAQGVPPGQGAMARFCLLQALRLNVLVAEMLDDSSIAEDGGLPRDVDDVCENELLWWVATARQREADIQPIPVLVASALIHLRDRLAEVRIVVTQLGAEAREDCERRNALELMLREMSAADRLLLRNEPDIAVELGEQRLELQRLIDNHPVAFAKLNRAAAYVRSQRLREQVLDEKPIARRRSALIDLIRARQRRGG